MCLFLSSTGHQREPGRLRAAEILLLLVSSCCESIWTLVLALRALCQQTQEEATRANCPLLREAVWSSVSKKNPAWLGSARLCSARLSSARLCSARLSSALLSSARLGLAQPGLAHLPFCLNRLMEVQVRAGRLQWKMKLEETAGLLG